MKTTHLISFSMAVLATLFCNLVYAQKGEPALLHTIYQFIHIDDLNNPSEPIDEEMELILGETESKYMKRVKKNPVMNQGGCRGQLRRKKGCSRYSHRCCK